MTDYGHDIIFGSFLTPRADNLPGLIRAAQHGERIGLDLVTAQDHPYQPAFVDTVALLGHLAAHTERVRLAPNVINLPLRPPAVLAKTFATMDLISGGRMDLGLGAGAFWDAIEAYGGRRLTPRQAVTALSEAIDVIRAIWDTSDRSATRIEGQYYRLVGAKRGPAPAHLVPIWIGAYKPRMLKLTGTKADGWLPSIGRMSMDEIRQANDIIDEAATTAGRDPREIQRLANISGQFGPASTDLLSGPSEQWVDQIVLLALEYGFSGFILTGDNTNDYDRIGAEVIPAARAAIAAERATAVVNSPTRPTFRLTAPGRGGQMRRPAPGHPDAVLPAGIDYAAVPAALAGKTFTPRDAGYDDIRSTYMAEGHPGLVIMAEAVEDVSTAVRYAAAQDVPLSVRSGGHGVDRTSTNEGGIVIDVSALDSIEVLDPAERRIRVGAGATWGQLAAAIGDRGWAMTSGNTGDVGVGGLGTNGGIGWLVRKYGYTVDHVVGADLVLADGTTVHVDAQHNPDLFWAVRGAGSWVGIVTALELRAIELGDVVFAALTFDATDTKEFLRNWAAVMTSAPRELTSFVNLSVTRPGRPATAQVMSIWAGDDTDAAIRDLQPLAGIAPLTDQQAQLLPYSALLGTSDSPQHGQQNLQIRNGFLPRMTPEIATAITRIAADPQTVQIELRSVGGAIADRTPNATAFAHRDAQFFLSLWGKPGPAEALDAAWAHVSEFTTGSYAAYQTDTRPERVTETFPPSTLERLKEITSRYDPTGLFGRR